MSISRLPLSYCTNVHPGLTVSAVLDGIEQYTAPLRQNYGAELAAGLWLAESVTTELKRQPEDVDRFRDRLTSLDLSCHTLNAFPYGNFHGDRVKETVYVPDWADAARLQYTQDCAAVLARLLPDDREGSISTVPLGFKEFEHADDFTERSISQLIDFAQYLDRLRQESGKLIRLAIEPEPFCLLETTGEAIAFFDMLWGVAAETETLDVVREHIGLCYDVCHQAVEFESIPDSFAALENAGVRINKVHITCAIELNDPAHNEEARRALARYVEPRYLHQTMGRLPDDSIRRCVDLSTELALNPNPEFRNAETWRIHFHVPVNAEQLGPLRTTRNELREALQAVSLLDYAPHLEVETYTWEVLPDGGSADLIDGLTLEMTSTRDLLSAVGS
ncbi:MAG: metabolite traffic protein EboE [Planctomycetota bacterium]|nr:metabolite traffic protein EboE [Planctomycetota bacterium]